MDLADTCQIQCIGFEEGMFLDECTPYFSFYDPHTDRYGDAYVFSRKEDFDAPSLLLQAFLLETSGPFGYVYVRNDGHLEHYVVPAENIVF